MKSYSWSLPFPASIKAPEDKMDGTHSPTYRPWSLYPLNQRYTDSKNESPAATKNSPFIFQIVDMLSS